MARLLHPQRALPLLLLVCHLGIAAWLAGCSDGGGGDKPGDPDAITQCSDGVDNDLDGLTDSADPHCTSPDDNDEFDNGTPVCADGLDNDSDGLIDFPADPGCLAPLQNSGEGDDCPSGANCPECGNGIDDDDDGKIDFAGMDPGCASASDDEEFSFDGEACGVGTAVSPLPVSGTVAGAINSGTSHVSATCGAGDVGTGPEVAYVVTVDRPMLLVASTDFPGTTIDTVLYVRRVCTDMATQLSCSDNVDGTNTRSQLSVPVQPGSYYIVVDAKTPGALGAFVLVVNLYAGPGEVCTDPSECAPGYVCRQVPGETEETCERPVCSDGRDDDGDTRIDYPADPGCTTPDDGTETDPCPGAGCPVCADGVDNDTDGETDYPDDVSCTSASGTSEADCPIETNPLLTVTSASTTGTTVGATSQFQPSCGFTFGDIGDRVHMLYVRAPLATLEINTNNSALDSVLSIYDGLCTGEIECDDDGGTPFGASRIQLTGVAAGSYAIVVDGYDEDTYNLNVSGTYAAGQACDPTMTMFRCPTGSACTGAPGSAICAPAACNDQVDADGDGFPGYPTDPGCSSTNDGDETDDCPSGPNCPQCADDVDNDGDSQIDYPMDPGCTAASGASESCVTTDPVRTLTTGALTNQSTALLANDFDLTCGADGRDEVYRVIIDHPIDEIRVNTNGSVLDSVIAIRSPTCSGFDLQCSETDIFLVDPAPGEYFIVIDDKNAASPGTYNLNVTGHYLGNGRCNPTGVFTCSTGFACQGAPGAETCTPAACNDTMDADGDGLPGFPSDPGCTSTSDGDEADDCPSGPNCPACANDVDDDGDGFIDYPLDPACAAASVNSELAPCTSADPVLVFTSNVTGASTAGDVNDVLLSCGANGRDDIYRLFVTQPLVSLQVDTLGSDINTALAVRVASCNSADLGCGVNNFGNGDSRVLLSNVAVGEYFIIVDDQFTAPTTYNLNVSGTLAGGSTCNPASTSFTCAAGFACHGAAGAETCILARCNDTIDADGDGRVGYPSDPGCTSTADDDEADNCPSGPGCPVCADGLDNDGDTRIDYPMDLGCVAASGASELECMGEMDPLLTVTTMMHSGTTTGASNDFLPSCRAAFSVAPDRVYLLTLPVPVTSLRLATLGSDYDTTLILKPASCGTAELACDDDGGVSLDSLIVTGPLAAGTYSIVMDGASSGSSGDYDLSIRGTVAAGQACTSPLFAQGVLACAGACTGGVCQ